MGIYFFNADEKQNLVDEIYRIFYKRRTTMKAINQTTLGMLATAMLVSNASAAVIVSDDFNYANLAAMQANWGTGSQLSLDSGVGNTAPSGFHSGTATTANIWIGSTFSLTPTDANPVRLTADIFSTGNADQANTVGLRTGANPLYEMGMYRFFDNVQTGPNTSAELTPTADGVGTRTINLGTDLPGQDWVKMGNNYTGWARWEATFTQFGVTTRIDYDLDGNWDASFTETGTTPTGAFTDLRIHSPVVGTGGGFNVDNIRLEVIPEPSTIALGLGGAGLMLGYLRRRMK